MAKEICISSTPHETRLAILEDDQLAEIHYERENEYTLAGSIYNGRVTRVLPGMQSAFVDLGLERDAFLYVTDFMELEDPEETDELEKAAVIGGSQPPREVRHTNGQDGNSQNARAGARTEDRSARPVQKPEQKPEIKPERPAQERPQRDRRLEAVPVAPEAVYTAPEAQIVSAEAVEQEDAGERDSGASGARRWRGRRRRRGSRGAAGPSDSPGSSETAEKADESEESYPEPEAESEVAPEIHASTATQGDAPFHAESSPFSAPASQPEWETAANPPVFVPASRTAPSPVPFVLPGESLSKYGGAPADDVAGVAAASGPAVPVRPASTFKPSTLIETPIEWDGSGLLPGESLSKHRGRRPEPIVESPHEPHAATSEAVEESGSEAASAYAIEEETFVEEFAEPAPQSGSGYAMQSAPEEVAPEGAANHRAEEQPAEEEEFEETVELAPASFEVEATEKAPHPAETQNHTAGIAIEQPPAEEPAAVPVTEQAEVAAELPPDPPAPFETAESDTESDAPEDGASASHRVDAAPPAGFQWFGLGGKKKTEEPPPTAVPEAKPATVAAVSSYAPGSGHIEEEVIEGEEFDAPHHRGKPDEHDLDDYEERTLPAQMRTGELGEMLQEAHLDHRIQLNFDEKNGEDDAFDEEDEDEDAPSGDAPPAAGPGQDSAQQRRDRGGRGRRGRGGQAVQSGQGGQGNRRGGPSRRSAQTSDLPIISDLLKPGQEILVQIAKEPIAKKGARITSHIALPGRFLVFMPTVSHIGVSRKIASDEERQRLKRILVHERGEASGGFIVRTAAEGASEEELRVDLRMLMNVWNDIRQRSESSKSPALIYRDLSLIERILRDQVSSNFSSIWVDSESDYERIVRFLNRISPALVRRVKLYTKETPLFEQFGIEDEIAKAMRSKVWLKSGGSIVINQTEALVAIDINTGKYVGKSARLEDTILKTNLDAVPELVRQIRLRDLGGIIVIDFIDMDERKNRFKVMAALEEALKSDRAPTKVLQFNDFGLVAITRKRVKQSLERTLSVPCPTCQATGMVKSPTTVCNEIYTELRKMRKHFEGADVLLRVNPETVKVLKSNDGSWLAEFEELVGKNILVKSDGTLHPEQFDIQG